jgi:hypothetical protein
LLYFHIFVDGNGEESGAAQAETQEYPMTLKLVTQDRRTQRRSLLFQMILPSGIVPSSCTVTILDDGTTLHVRAVWPSSTTEERKLQKVYKKFLSSIGENNVDFQVQELLSSAMNEFCAIKTNVVDDVASILHLNYHSKSADISRKNVLASKVGL